jgi:biopolymer transport protein ExbB/TolQ
MLYRHLIEGSIYVMLPIYILWIVNILLICGLFYRLLIRKNIDKLKAKSLSELILFTGSFSVILGILWQIIGLRQMLEVISEIGSISPKIIAGGIIVSMHSTIYGLLLFFLSFVAWFAFNRINK